VTFGSRMARSAATICDASASESEAATGGSGRGVAVGDGEGVAVATMAEPDGSAEGVGDAETDSAGRPLETVHAVNSSAIAPVLSARRITTSLARTRPRAPGAGGARGRSA